MTSRRDSATGMVCVWIGVGEAYFSSASARVMGCASPKSWKQVNVKTFDLSDYEAARMKRRRRKTLVKDIPA
jgi:hypothetical protein